jgi:hypothetical protein
MELLLAACLLSISLVPLLYVFRLTRPPERKTAMEFQATLLAHHVLERIVAEKEADPNALPQMTPEEPIVIREEGYRAVSSYFRPLLGHEQGLEESHNGRLFWSLKPFQCQVDTYYLENHLYKVIAYITYEEDGRKKRVFLERLLDHPLPQSLSSLSPAEGAP